MIRTLIVDDEYLIRYGIKNSVDWNLLGYEIIGEADNGQAALTQIRNLHPDLVLLDLNLPIMDGIEVCRRIMEQRLNTEVIILTGYDEFKYIQECLRLGVLNYVVKPVETDELTTALQKAKQTIGIKKNMFRHRQPETASYATDDTLQSVCDKINRELSKQTRTVYAALAEVDYLKRENPSSNAQSAVLSCAAEAVIQFAQEQSLDLTCTRYEDQIVLFFSETLADIRRCVSALQEYLHAQLGLSISVGLCTKRISAGLLQHCIEVACDALAQKFHDGAMSFFEAEERLSQNLSLEINTSRLYGYLLKAQGKESLHYIEEMLTKAAEVRLGKNNYILLCAGIINTVLNFSTSQSIQLDAAMKNQFSISTYLDYYETAAEIKSELMDACSGFVLKFIKKSQTNPLVREVIEYVDHHYSDCTLSSGNIAKELSVSPNYLSRIFRQELGLTITEYITQKRISEAVNRIENSKSISIAELAHSVGYSDSFYFSKIFHKLKGVSPSNYVEIENAKKE